MGNCPSTFASSKMALPKSQILTLKSLLKRIFGGFKSQCSTPLEWISSKALRIPREMFFLFLTYQVWLQETGALLEELAQIHFAVFLKQVSVSLGDFVLDKTDDVGVVQNGVNGNFPLNQFSSLLQVDNFLQSEELLLGLALANHLVDLPVAPLRNLLDYVVSFENFGLLHHEMLNSLIILASVHQKEAESASQDDSKQNEEHLQHHVFSPILLWLLLSAVLLWRILGEFVFVCLHLIACSALGLPCLDGNVEFDHLDL